MLTAASTVLDWLDFLIIALIVIAALALFRKF